MLDGQEGRDNSAEVTARRGGDGGWEEANIEEVYAIEPVCLRERD